MLFNKILLIVLMLVAARFFGLKYFSETQIKLIQFFALVFGSLSIIVRDIYGSVNNKNEKHFIIPIILILTGVFLSSITTYSFHN